MKSGGKGDYFQLEVLREASKWRRLSALEWEELELLMMYKNLVLLTDMLKILDYSQVSNGRVFECNAVLGLDVRTDKGHRGKTGEIQAESGFRGL